ncbi:MAG: flagellar filament capping protein FliD [Pseudomonadota bacterium]
MAIESIAKTLGSGSGIDITALVTQLVDAQYAAKTNAFTKRDETLKAQVSAAAGLKSGMTSFDSALKTLIKTGTLATQPVSSNPALVKVSTLAGGSAAKLAATIEVRQLAAAQVASTAPILDKTAAIGTGKLTLTFGAATVVDGDMTGFTAGATTPVDIAITAANSSLEGIRDAINAKNAGVTASILSDAGGSRLVVKSSTGATQAFTLAATEDSGAEGLAALNIGVGATATSVDVAAQDAVVAVDGVALRRASNSLLDLVPGVKLELVGASVGTRVTLSAEAPTAALEQAVNDVVDTFNELLGTLKTATDPVTGPLRSDPAARAMLRSLAGLTTATLVANAAAGTPATLGSIGVATNRDGTLSVDATQLTNALLNYGSSVEAMFKGSAGLSAALATIADAATNKTYGLGASEARYTKAQTSLAGDQEKATAAAESLRTRMTRQFAGMDSAVAAYKSTQTFLTNQVAAWNAKDS